MRAPPRVSIAMPVWNPDPVYFPQAVESALAQTFKDLELVIVEDPSPSSAASLLARFDDPRIRLFTNPARTSLVAQRNRVFQESRGALVAMLDADDVAAPTRIAKQVAFLDEHPDVGVLGSSLTVIDESGATVGYREYPATHDEIARALPRYNPIANPSAMVRRQLVLDAGGYDFSLDHTVEDYDLWCRLARNGVRFANLPEPLLAYRVHPRTSKAERLRAMLRGSIALKEKYFQESLDARARARLWAERFLLLVPPALVYKLFMALTYDRHPPPRSVRE